MSAATNGHETILDRLRAEHGEIRRALAALEEAPRDRRAPHFAHLRRLLVRHETTERVLVHPATAMAPDGAHVAAAVEHEERASERSLARLQRLDPAGQAFDDGFRALRDEVLAHADHEEREEFPRLRVDLDHDTQVSLADAARALVWVAPTRPHPRVPTNPASQLAMGPLLGVLDRLRDLTERA